MLYRNKKKIKPELNHVNLIKARNMLFEVVNLLDNNNIRYHLEGGTLLGLVRDKELIPWDHDIDLSIPITEVNKTIDVLKKLYCRGFKITKRKSKLDYYAIKKGNYRIFKIKKFIPSLLKMLYPGYNKYYIVLDIFVKSSDDKFTYWEAQKKIMKVENRYYESYERIKYLNRWLKVPNDYRGYLNEKYGDWSSPVKDWVSGRDEKTICR